MEKPKIVVYYKSFCGWSGQVMSVLDQYGLKYEAYDVRKDQKAYGEMFSKTQQSLAPCVEINGVMLIDVGGEEVESHLVEAGLVNSDVTAQMPSTDKEGRHS